MTPPDNHQSQDMGTLPPRGATRFFGKRANLQTPTEALHPERPPPPPLRPNSKRRPMLSAFSGVLSFILVAAVLGLGILAYASSKLAEPGPLTEDKVVFIAPRTEVTDIVDQLYKSGVIRDPTVLKVTLVIDRKWSQVKAGEYLFKRQASLNDVIDMLVAGKSIQHSVTIPEGLTSEQIVARLRQNELLSGEILEIPPEGTLLPETYRVLRGQSRATLLRQMREQQTRLLDQIWERRSPDVPLRSKLEMLTMASIIEKETGRADERSRVAAVFYNRLRRGMKLQSDPTIVYGLVGGKGTLGRPIQRDEITRPTRFNTYVIPALPPGPIANPGRASLEAAANPARTNELFFVADGAGGHAFAETLEQHNRNVQRWREIERERAAVRAQQLPGESNLTTDRVAPGVEPDPVAAPPTRGRRSDLPGGEVFGEMPESLNGRSVALGDLGRALREPSSTRAAATPAAHNRLPRAATAFAPAPAQTQSVTRAPAAPAQAQTTQTQSRPTDFRLGPGLSDLGIQIAGVDPAPSALDGPITQSEPDEPVNMQTHPMGTARRNEMNARAAQFGAGTAPSGPVETLSLVDAEPAPRGQASASPALRRISDASEGTALDPLRSRGWDLNATHNIPADAQPAPARPTSQRRATPARQ